MRNTEREQRHKIADLSGQAEEVFALRQENTRLGEECKALKEQLEKNTEKLKVMGDLVSASEQLKALMRVVNDDEQCGLAPVVTGAMFEQSKSALIQAEACAALEGIMSRSTAITPRASDPWWQDCVHPVLEAMRNFPHYGAVQTNGCDVLWKLCLQDGNFHDLILRKDGLTCILTAIQNHGDDKRLVYSACGAMRKLLACSKAENGEKDQALTPRLKQDDSGVAMGVHAANLIVQTMAAHLSNPAVVEGCVSSLCELASRGEEIKRAITSAKIIGTIFEAMHTHSKCMTLRVASLKFLLAMLENRPSGHVSRALQTEIAAKEKEMGQEQGRPGMIADTVERQRQMFTEKQAGKLNHLIDKAATMTGLKEEDDDDNADADVSWIHNKA